MTSHVSLDFLSTIYPQGPWCLTAIDPEKKKGPETRTFYPATKDRLLAWLALHSGTRNLYWHVNPVSHEVEKKAEREDIKEVCYFHVDVDPGLTDSLQKEQERILAMFLPEQLGGKPKKGVPLPTFVVFSGGGYQAFWKLATAIQINGDLTRAEDAKRYNQQLENIYGADRCHNIDRLMRLPGNMNIPDAKKVAKGRVPAMAKVSTMDMTRVYDVAEFKQATLVQLGGDTALPSSSKMEVNIPGNVEPFLDLHELDKWKVPMWVSALITGEDMDEAKTKAMTDALGKYPSRSERLFSVVCWLVRCDVPDAIIYSIITDDGWKISESVLDKKGGAARYATRQIQRAKEFTLEPWLQKMNDEYTVIGNYGGKCLVMEQFESEGVKNRKIFSTQSFEEFKKRYRNEKVQVGMDAQGNPKFESVGKWWLGHPKCNQVDRIIFAPDKVETPNKLNLWQGFAVTPTPGEKHVNYLAHVKDIICGGDEVNYEYLIKWMARAVQQPASAGQVAVVIQGGRGAGKGFFVQGFGALFGRHFMQVSNPSHLVGNFNAHLRDALVIFSDEAFYAGDRKHNSVLKTLITEETLPIEAKGVDVQFGENYVHLIMASNDDHVVRTGIDERRFFILKVKETRKQDTEYFAALQADLDAGGYEHLLDFLMSVDLEGFQVRDVPKTDALKEQTDMSLDPREEWLMRRLEEGTLLPKHDEWVNSIPRENLFNAFSDDVAKTGKFNSPGNPTQFGKFLVKIMPMLRTEQLTVEVEVPDERGFNQIVKRRPRCYVFPPLDEARAAWDKYRGKPQKWT